MIFTFAVFESLCESTSFLTLQQCFHKLKLLSHQKLTWECLAPPTYWRISSLLCCSCRRTGSKCYITSATSMSGAEANAITQSFQNRRTKSRWWKAVLPIKRWKESLWTGNGLKAWAIMWTSGNWAFKKYAKLTSQCETGVLLLKLQNSHVDLSTM